MDDLQPASIVVSASSAVDVSSETDGQDQFGLSSNPTLEGHMKSVDEVEPSSRTAQFLRGKGFGWLLEIDESTDDEDKPLL